MKSQSRTDVTCEKSTFGREKEDNDRMTRIAITENEYEGI